MVAFSRTCRLLVRRRDDVTLVISDLPIVGAVQRPSQPWGTVAGVESGATFQPTCGKKKADWGLFLSYFDTQRQKLTQINRDRNERADLRSRQMRGWPLAADKLFSPNQQPGGPDAIRPIYDAFASAGVRPLRGSSMGPPDPALGRRARVQRGLDWGASHGAVGTASRARSVDRASADGDPPYPARPRRVPAALSPSGGARQPGSHARPHGPRPAQLRRRRQRPAERLGDVQRRRLRRAASRNDARGARHHSEAVDRGGTLRIRRQILEGDQDRPDAGELAPAYPAVSKALSADRRRRGQ